MIRRKAIFFFLFLPLVALMSSKKGEDGFVLTEDYPCVHYDKNVIGNAAALNKYFKAIDELVLGKRDKLRIVHIGDSHIQADYLTHTTRQLLQKTYGNGGRGFVFPYRLLRSNNPENIKISATGDWDGCVSTSYRTQCNFGICGASTSTYDSTASLKIDPDRYRAMNYDFSRLDIFHFGNPNAPRFRFLNGDSSELEVDILKESNSISSAHFTSDQDSMWLAFEKRDTYDFVQLFGLSFENDDRGVIYHSIGLNGAHVQSYLRNQFFDEQLQHLNADLIIISLGTNDGYMSSRRFCDGCFKDNYSYFLTKIRGRNPEASILLTTPGDYYRRRRYHDINQRQVVRVIGELSEKHETGIWDFNSIMGGSYAIKDWVRNGLARYDLVHYTEDGYVLQGKLLYDALMKADFARIEPAKPEKEVTQTEDQ